MQLYADENFPLPVVEELRRLGHDVLTVQEDGRQATPDPDEGFSPHLRPPADTLNLHLNKGLCQHARQGSNLQPAVPKTAALSS